MTRRIFSIFFVLALTLSSFSTVFADDGVTPLEPEIVIPAPEGGEIAADTQTLWFVELSGAPLADGGAASALNAEKTAFRAAAKKAKIQYTERFAFSNLWNGFSVEAGSSQLSKLASMPGVKNIYPVGIVSIPETQPTIEPELFTAIAQTGADIAQNELGYTGAGIKVAVMDTGTDYNHPDLGGCFCPGCRVFTGWDFVGDAYNADPSSV
jgi:subtilisin family serine protease